MISVVIKNGVGIIANFVLKKISPTELEVKVLNDSQNDSKCFEKITAFCFSRISPQKLDFFFFLLLEVIHIDVTIKSEKKNLLIAVSFGIHC